LQLHNYGNHNEYYVLQAGNVPVFDEVLTAFLSIAPEEHNNIYLKGEAKVAKSEGKSIGQETKP
jgi:hypothetical protein